MFIFSGQNISGLKFSFGGQSMGPLEIESISDLFSKSNKCLL